MIELVRDNGGAESVGRARSNPRSRSAREARTAFEDSNRFRVVRNGFSRARPPLDSDRSNPGRYETSNYKTVLCNLKEVEKF